MEENEEIILSCSLLIGINLIILDASIINIQNLEKTIKDKIDINRICVMKKSKMIEKSILIFLKKI